jgi:hypothetical protein
MPKNKENCACHIHFTYAIFPKKKIEKKEIEIEIEIIYKVIYMIVYSYILPNGWIGPVQIIVYNWIWTTKKII